MDDNKNSMKGLKSVEAKDFTEPFLKINLKIPKYQYTDNIFKHNSKRLSMLPN